MDTQLLSLITNPTAQMKAQQDFYFVSLVAFTITDAKCIQPEDLEEDVDNLNYEVVSGEWNDRLPDHVRFLHSLFVTEMYALRDGDYNERAAAMGKITAVLVDWEKKYLCADKDKFHTLMSLFRMLTLASCKVNINYKKMSLDQRRVFVEERLAFIKLINKNNRNNPKLIFDALVAGWAKLAPLNEVINTLTAR